MRGFISPDSWRREDRILAACLKVGLVAGMLAIEVILIASFAYLMWRAINRA